MMPDRLTAMREVTTAIAEYLRVPVITVQSSAALLDLPGFDSIAVVAVLERLEETFDVEVAPELVVPEAFESLGTLTDLFVHPARSTR
jgi:acyl carrier protein